MTIIKKKKSAAKTVKANVRGATIRATTKKKTIKAASSVRTAPAPKPAVVPSAKGEMAGIESLRAEIGKLRNAVEKSLSPIATGAMEEVDALRRVLSYLFEARTEDIIRELVAVRHAAASIPNGGRNVTERIDTLLANLGAVKFEAERLEYVDPLIHAITREGRDDKLDDAVIVEAIRPGFRTARGVVVAKALVAINRRS